MSDSYTIQKREIPADVILPNHPPEHLRIFLDPNPLARTGFQRPSDIFSDAAAFLPAKNDTGVVFLRRDSIMAISVAADLEHEASDACATRVSSGQAKTLRVEVLMEDETTFRGEISYLLPAGHSRIQDFLGLEERHLSIRDGDLVHIINKRHILRVTLS